MAITRQKTQSPCRRMMIGGACTIVLIALASGPSTPAKAAPIHSVPAVDTKAVYTVEVTPVALSKAQARMLLGKIKRLTRKLKSDNAKLKAATAKVKKINATLR